jgi:hypothetical protein
MTPAEHQSIMDIAEVQVNRYFDHYLSEVFPQQIERIMNAHNQDAEAHEPRIAPLVKAKRRVDRMIWMVLGGSAVIGCVGTLIVEHLPSLIEALVP